MGFVKERLSIWKEGITIEQKEKIKEDLIGSISDFHFIDNEFHNNTTYVMAFNQNQELMFKDEDEFAWEANNIQIKKFIFFYTYCKINM